MGPGRNGPGRGSSRCKPQGGGIILARNGWVAGTARGARDHKTLRSGLKAAVEFNLSRKLRFIF